MPNDRWDRAIAASAAPERVRAALASLKATAARDALAAADAEQARIWAALFAASPWAVGWLGVHPEWLAALTPRILRSRRHAAEFQREVTALVEPALAARDYAGALDPVRRVKQRELIRLAARDLAGFATLPELVRELSDVADVCLAAVERVCRQRLRDRFGQPFHQEASGVWRPTPFAVLGLGKLGGQELNYSSDVDVLFVYGDEGGVFKTPPGRGKSPRPGLTNHQFFTRLAEALIAEVGRLTAEGQLYRIDLRLRPEGNAGPLVRSLAGYENYYAQWGQTWERMMLIKARGVAGNPSLAGEFLELIQSFRYPRSLGLNVPREVAAMKQRTEDEIVKAGDRDREVKRGRGGLREIEFTVQTLQLLHAGRNPFLQGASTLPLLEQLARYRLLPEADAAALAAAYCFLRNVEHRLQMEHNQQTHTIPSEPTAHVRLARLMGFPGVVEFEAARSTNCERVRAVYDRLVSASPETAASSLPRDFDGHAEIWARQLAAQGFRDPARAIRLLKEFAFGPGHGHVSARTTERAFDLIRRLLALCPPAREQTAGRTAVPPETTEILSDPDRVVARLDRFVSAYGARATLYDVWAANLPLFKLLLLLFDRSEFLAEVAIRTPDLVDELMLGGHLRRRKSADDVRRELQHGRDEPDQRLWLRRYHRSEFMRIGLREILGLADLEASMAELSALADACLDYALELVLRENQLRQSPFAIIGLGKLGGAEINYGSDLDVMFVASSDTKNLPKLQPLAASVIEALSASTELGVAFVVDARLRPDGEKGLLVNTLAAAGKYYRQRAQLWELQALVRVRLVGGDREVGRQFCKLAACLTDFSEKAPGQSANGKTSDQPALPAAFTPGWRQEIVQMRQRIEQQRTPPGKDALAIKTGVGGLMDAEFAAQTLCLAHGWQEPNTLRALRRAREAGVLLPAEADRLIENYRSLRRVEAILRRWSFEGEVVLPDDPAAQYRVAVRCGFRDAATFFAALAGWRQAIREGYEGVMRGA